ncbi:hypothetical protein [Dyella japonica]|uniref:Uncharacterized protein n=1 Tax=Dyella japonica A8 TaxID=1217721 RepID=A0A075K3G4_9GAMM|nr:hypothetical protein [Dyella japonica]AIF48771.1 hypothetical protein HY57_16735 [Dyella japonica A8]
MLQTAPNIAYLKAAWAAFAGISGANATQSYEAAGLSFTRINHSTLVRKNDVQVSTMPLHYTRHELRVGFLGRIENEVRKAVSEMDAVFWRDLCLPEGHRLVIELEECLRMLRRRGNRSLSILIQPDGTAATEACVRVEMRVFLDSPRACVFAHAADATTNGFVDLLEEAPKRARLPRARDYAELARQMSATLNEAFAAFPRAQLAA